MVGWCRLIPGPSDLVFALVLVFVLIGGRHALFNDPGTLWHLRLGRDIVASGSVPRCDTLTFTRTHAPWVDQSWGFDALLALVVDHAGWSAAVALTALVLAAVYSALAGGLIRDGISPVVAVVVSLAMAAIGCIHFLIRPHILTLAFVYLTLRVCQKQHERGGLSIVWVPVLTAILANLHGGFLALPAIVATAAVGHAISGPWDQARQRNVIRFFLAFLASCLTALFNPYGWDLYRLVDNLLIFSGVTSLISEYQSAPFGKPEARRAGDGPAGAGRPVRHLEPSGGPLSSGPPPGLAPPRADLDPQRPLVRPGRRCATGHAARQPTASAPVRLDRTRKKLALGSWIGDGLDDAGSGGCSAWRV